MGMKVNKLIIYTFLYILLFSSLSSPVFAVNQSNKCLKILWVTVCIPVPPHKQLPHPFPFPTKKIKPSPTNKPTSTPTPTATPIPTITPTPTPLTIGAKLSEYVQPTGQDCDIAIPSDYATIQAGVNAAVSGDTVCVAEGVFNEDIVINKAIRLSGNGPDKSIINGQGINYLGYGVSTVVIPDSAESNITIEGFSINGVGTGPFDSTVLLLGNSSGAKIRYNHIVSGINGYAFYVQWVRSNDIIQHNIFEGNNSNQVAKFSHDGPSENEQIVNNTFTGTVTSTGVSDSGVVFSFGGKNSILKQNVFNTNGTVLYLMGIAFTPNIVTENNFNSPTDRKLYLSGGNSTPLSAENNWWGDTDPSDKISGDVDFIPFAMTPFIEN